MNSNNEFVEFIAIFKVYISIKSTTHQYNLHSTCC